MTVEYMYVASGVAIVLVLLLLVQMNNRAKQPKRSQHMHYNVFVDTSHGMIRTDNRNAANNLQMVRDKLVDKKRLASDSCQELVPLIKASMINLIQFINENPKMNAQSLCKLDLRSNIINDSMQNSLLPGHDWKDEFQTVLDWEESENRMVSSARDRMEHLIRNVDIVIQMLRLDVCDYGRINISKLHQILLALNKWACIADENPNAPRFPNEYADVDEYTAHKDLPLYMKSHYTIEPMESKESLHRQKPGRESFASMNDTSFGDIGSRSPINTSLVNSDNTAAFESVYKQLDQSMNKRRQDNFEGQITDLEIPENANDYSELLGQATVINNAYSYHYNKMGSTLLDGSPEGLAERDVLGYRSPGHIIGQLYDRDDHFTPNINSCLGKTVGDDELWSQCTTHDMRPKLALDGEAHYMISGLEHSMHV
jgi:hypothetical protein